MVKKVEKAETTEAKVLDSSKDNGKMNITEHKRGEKESKSYTFPIVLVFVGLLLLANNLGLISWQVWLHLWRFWPVIFIVWGVQLIAGRHIIGRILAVVVSVIFLFSVFALAIVSGDSSVRKEVKTRFPNFPMNVLEKVQPVILKKSEIITEDKYLASEMREINVDMVSNTYEITDNTSNNWLKVESEYLSGTEPIIVSGTQNENLLKLNVEQKPQISFGFWPGPMTQRIIVGKTNVRSDIKIDSTSGNGKIVLSELLVKDITFKTTSGNIDAQFTGKSIPEKVEVKVTSGNTKLLLPTDVGIRVTYSIRSGSIKVDDQNATGTGVYVSEDYDSATQKIEISIDITSGNVEILRK